MKFNPLLLPVCCPRFLKKAGLLCRGDPESSERQDDRANADVRLRALTNMPALRTPKTAGRMCRSERIRCSIVSRSSRKSMSASHNMPGCQRERSRSIISGNHNTFCASPAAISRNYCSVGSGHLGQPDRSSQVGRIPTKRIGTPRGRTPPYLRKCPLDSE